MSDQDKIREDAHTRWEAEERPEGRLERHGNEVIEAHDRSTGTPQTWSADHGGAIGSDSRGSGSQKHEGIRPEDLNSENDQGAG